MYDTTEREELAAQWVFVLTETLVGVVVGYVFLNYYDEDSMDLNRSIVHYYTSLNGVFFSSTLLIGLLHALYTNKMERIVLAIILSIAFGILSITLYIAFDRILGNALHLRIVPLYIMLIGYIAGFNFGLTRKMIS